MDAEKASSALLSHLLTLVDPARIGWCIEVGVGNKDLYCELFARLSYASVAVEPLVTPRLKRLCYENNIRLFEAALGEHNGETDLYLGHHSPDHSSTQPDWWAVGSRKTIVRSITLGYLLAELDDRPLTCLKVDVEGAEWSVLRQLEQLDPQSLPEIIMFEYGGRIPQRGIDGWIGHFYESTINCLRLMQRLGYQTGIVIDDSPGTTASDFDFQAPAFDPEGIFPKSVVYGNIIVLRQKMLSAEDVDSITRRYYESTLQRPLRRLIDRFK